MALASWFAIYFIVWWVTLFAVLPFSLRTQDEDRRDLRVGTTESAPVGSHVLRAFVRTTIVSLLLTGAYAICVEVYGVSLSDLPVLVPGLEDFTR